MANQSIQQPKADQKGKVIISLIIGILGAISLILWWSGYYFTEPISFFLYERNLKWLSFLIICFAGGCSPYTYVYLLPFFALGIFFGIKGLKSSKRKLAIAGIILCTIDLIVSLFTTYLWWWFLGR